MMQTDEIKVGECVPFVLNSGVTGRGTGGRVPPETSDREISADLPRKKEARKKGERGKMEKKRRKNCKKEGGKLKMKGGKV